MDKKHLAFSIVNYCLVVFFICLSIYQFFILPFLYPENHLLLLLSILPLILVNNTFWSLIHEGIHHKLFARRSFNDKVSRLLSIFFCSPFRALQFAHLLHHRYNRTPFERNDQYDPEIVSTFQARGSFYFRLIFGVYIQELIFPFITLLPRNIIISKICPCFTEGSYKRIAIDAFLKKKNNLSETRQDLFFILTLLSMSFYCYAERWPLLLLLIMIRAFFISVSDYSYHYGTRTDDIQHALNFSLPKWLSLALLNFNYHGTHHRHPRALWHTLPTLFAAEKEMHDGGFFNGIIKQFYGPKAQKAKD